MGDEKKKVGPPEISIQILRRMVCEEKTLKKKWIKKEGDKHRNNLQK